VNKVTKLYHDIRGKVLRKLCTIFLFFSILLVIFYFLLFFEYFTPRWRQLFFLILCNNSGIILTLVNYPNIYKRNSYKIHWMQKQKNFLRIATRNPIGCSRKCSIIYFALYWGGSCLWQLSTGWLFFSIFYLIHIYVYFLGIKC